MSGQPSNLALRRLEIRNFRGIDSLELDFPKPRFSDEPDVWVIGSRNGLGKTSVLQAISLTVFLARAGEKGLNLRDFSRDWDLCQWVRSGAGEAKVVATFGDFDPVELTILPNGICKLEAKTSFLDHIRYPHNHGSREQGYLALLGQIPDPLWASRLMFFHSYRMVRDGDPELGMLLEDEEEPRYSPRRRAAYALFKIELIKMKMGQANLFESIDKATSDSKTIDLLLKRYAGVELGKLKPGPDSSLGLRVRPVDGSDRESYSFDGLSSGQKEILSTLFLISRFSEKMEICLIDEPELHLNTEWHSMLVADLKQFAPNTQFLLASHSEHVFAAVDPSRRILLEEDGP